MIRIGIIGAGTMGKAHAESLANLPDAALAAVADVDLEKAGQLAALYPPAEACPAGRLVAMDAVDAVIVATPTALHFQHTRSALEQGKHVYVEMPFVRHLREGEELIDLAREKNLLLTVGHLLRYYPEYELIKQQVEKGDVGRPGMIRLGRRTPHPRRWYSNFESSGGVVLDAMCHEFDFLQWCFGPVHRVYCQGFHGRRSTETLDYALASLRLENGAVAHVESSWCHYGQFLLDVEIAGQRGLIRYSNQNAVPLELSLLDEATGGRRYLAESPVRFPAHFRLLKAFLEAVQGQGENPVSGEEGLSAVRIALAAIESCQKRRPITWKS